MTKIKYIFRDFWWVVAQLDVVQHSYISRISSMYGISREELLKYLSNPLNKFRRWEISEQVFWKTFSQSIQLPLHKDYKKIFHTPLTEYSVYYKSIIAFVHRLQKLGYVCVILSDEVKPQAMKIRRGWWYEWFDDRLLSFEIGLSKYDDKINNTTKIFRYALKKYKLKPQEAIFIDDVAKNCAVAEKLGIKTVVAKGPRETIREVKKILKI